MFARWVGQPRPTLHKQRDVPSTRATEAPNPFGRLPEERATGSFPGLGVGGTKENKGELACVNAPS